MTKGQSIVGSSRAHGDREEHDFYPTPAYVTKALLDREFFPSPIWECACGDGAMSNAISNYKLQGKKKVFSSDLIDRGFGKGGVDFLKWNGGDFASIITNPPYKHSLEFVLQAKKVARMKIAMFLKTVFLESERRYPMFKNKSFPLKCIYQFSKRVTLYKAGEKMENSGMQAYAWFVWERGYHGKPYIDWICIGKEHKDQQTFF